MFTRTRKDDNPWPARPVRIRPTRDTAAQIQALVDGAQAAAWPSSGSWTFTAEVIAVHGNGRTDCEREI